MIQKLEEALAARRLHVENVGGTLNVRHGTGPTARAINLDPSDLLEWVGSRPDAVSARDIAGWANGVHTTLLEPRHSDASTWSFVESAGALFPTLESAGFRLGVRDATGGDAAWVRPFDGDELVFGWVMRLGRGLRPVTEAQVERWGVTEDRIVAAGRSMLYHSTRELRWVPTEHTDVVKLSLGDGHDAARIMVAADVFFVDVTDDWRFAMPDPDVLLATKASTNVDALLNAAADRARQSSYPLDQRAWKLASHGPMLAEH